MLKIREILPKTGYTVLSIYIPLKNPNSVIKEKWPFGSCVESCLLAEVFSSTCIALNWKWRIVTCAVQFEFSVICICTFGKPRPIW